MDNVNLEDVRPITRRRNGNDVFSPIFQKRMTPLCKWYFFMRAKILADQRDTPVNPHKAVIEDTRAMAISIKEMVKELGAEIVGIAAYNPSLIYNDADVVDHKYAIVFGIAMKYDIMVDIGPKSQEEVHRVYFTLDEIGVRLTHRIGAYGYGARTHPNTGDFPLPAYGYLAGLGELGKHGCLMSPDLGSSFRLSAVTTDLPLEIDGPQDYGYNDICTSCDICTRFCPGEAISPQKEKIAGVVRWHVDSDKCQPYFSKLFGCKICLSVCPITARAPKLRDSYKEMAKMVRDAKDAAGMLAAIDEATPLHLEQFEGLKFEPKRISDLDRD